MNKDKRERESERGERRLLCNYLDIWRRSLETEHDIRQTKAPSVFARFLAWQSFI
jgi:hypothetical protein